ncbi:uroporphyrinogen-III synthase [Hydrogenophaga sp.]|uniref:uroporphyrinogen-III synthase n=1 Tax=Hydrogenophaga sp. TaxID=1904254 RepID=UPI003F6AADD3
MTADPAVLPDRHPLAPLQSVIVTRPEPEAGSWVRALLADGWPAQALPLITIAEPADKGVRERLEQARAHWLDADAIMFVSAAAVQHFFSDAVQAPPGASVRPRFWAPGPGTARALALALAARGLGPEHIDAPAADAVQFDSETLWPVVAPQLRPGQRILIVRGASEVSASEPAGQALAGNGRDWLIRQCQAAGALVDACVAYERRAPAATPAVQAGLNAASAPGSVWLFSSSEALAHLRRMAPQCHWVQATALATHPRIAATARAAGFGSVVETRPALPDVLRALESNWSRP